MEMKQLGGTSFQVSALGTGVWSWGARTIWGYGRDFGLSDVQEAFQASLDAGINLFDTAAGTRNGCTGERQKQQTQRAESSVHSDDS